MKIMLKSFEGEKDTQYDIGVISAESKGLFKIVNVDEVDTFVALAKAEIEEDKKKSN